MTNVIQSNSSYPWKKNKALHCITFLFKIHFCLSDISAYIKQACVPVRHLNVATYVKQKKSVVEPTRKKVAADTGTYREGRRGLLGGTTAWGRGDEDGPRPPLLLLPPGITSCVWWWCVCLFSNCYAGESVIQSFFRCIQWIYSGGVKMMAKLAKRNKTEIQKKRQVLQEGLLFQVKKNKKR